MPPLKVAFLWSKAMAIFSDLAQVMQNARTDAKTLDNYIHGAADTKVTSRLGK